MYTELNNIKHAERILNSMAQDENIRVWIKNQDGTTIRIQPGCKIKRTDFGFKWPIKRDKGG